jgi:membrane protein
MNRKEFVEIAISSLRKWQDNNATLRAAALAFFIILPLPSILLISADIYSQIYGYAQGIQQLIQQISVFAGPTIGNLVGQLLQDSSNSLNSVFNSIFIIIFAIAGVIGAFAVLQDTFNVLWNVKLPKHRSAKTRVKERFVPFVLVMVAAIIAGGWFEFTGLLSSAVSNALGKTIGMFGASVFLFWIQVFLSFGSAILLFAVIFREIPDTPVEWGDVWLGAIIAAIAFVVLNNVFRFYLQNFPVTTLAGAAGSLIILLLWIFLIGQILLYGAQFTHCWAESVGSHAGKGENHQHPWKRWRAGGTPNGKTTPESTHNEISGFRFGRDEKEKGELRVISALG